MLASEAVRAASPGGDPVLEVGTLRIDQARREVRVDGDPVLLDFGSARQALETLCRQARRHLQENLGIESGQ